MSVGIVAQRGNPRAAALAGDIRAAVESEVWIDEETATTLGVDGVPVSAMSSAALVVSIGGDGTFLYSARAAGGVPVMGVNLGEVGFLNATAPEDAVAVVLETVANLRAGQMEVRELPRLAAFGDDWSLPDALNEIAVMGEQRGHGNGIEIEVRVDGSLYTGGQADGVLVATPTGSSAYNLSEGGPFVHPDAGGFVVTEMAAGESMPPLVVDTDATVTIRVDGKPRAVAVSDGRRTVELSPPTDVTIEQAPVPVRVAGPPLDFFAALGKLD